MTEWMDRSAWTTTPANASNGTWRNVLGMVAHYPAAGAAIGKASAARVAALLTGWRNYHVSTRGWGDIGYNMAIDQAGRVWTLRGLSNVGAHCASTGWPDANTRFVGVLFVVGNDEPLTPEAIAAWHALRAVVLERFPGATEVTGHGLVRGASTACPGPQIKAALGVLRDGSATPVGNPIPTPTPTPTPTPAPRPTTTPGGSIMASLPTLNWSAQRTNAPDAMDRRVQALLKAAGFYTGALDGLRGPLSLDALRRFQVKTNTGDGKGGADMSVGPATWRALLGV